jgi:hypothetical protein
LVCCPQACRHATNKKRQALSTRQPHSGHRPHRTNTTRALKRLVCTAFVVAHPLFPPSSFVAVVHRHTWILPRLGSPRQRCEEKSPQGPKPRRAAHVHSQSQDTHVDPSTAAPARVCDACVCAAACALSVPLCPLLCLARWQRLLAATNGRLAGAPLEHTRQATTHTHNDGFHGVSSIALVWWVRCKMGGGGYRCGRVPFGRGEVTVGHPAKEEHTGATRHMRMRTLSVPPLLLRSVGG